MAARVVLYVLGLHIEEQDSLFLYGLLWKANNRDFEINLYLSNFFLSGWTFCKSVTIKGTN